MKLLVKILIFQLLFITTSFSKVDEVVDRFYSSLENFLEENFENTDFSIKKIETIKPEIGIQTFKIFSEDSSDLSFFQGSLFLHDSDRETFNLGLGQRYLTDDDSILFGLNAFYDYEFDYEHQRFSIGAEIKSSILDLNYNQYFAQSSSKKGKDSKNEEAIDGYDAEVGAHLPYIPSMKVYLKAFDFEVPSGNDFQGLEFSTQLKIPNSGLSFEIGHTDYDNHTDQSFINIKYSNNERNPETSLFSDNAYEKISMKDRMYEKVRRDNIIKKKGASFTVKAGGF
ncbi:inverse autotransporter beta domain-containing protein [Candidatus Pelagibacter sp.]|nr:inverse autotransporter beta domain-containing protein [Candidatus Pelagibacter sp.]